MEFVVREWDHPKALVFESIEDGNYNPSDNIWYFLTSVSSKAAYSAELVNFLSCQNLTFILGRPKGGAVSDRLRTPLRAAQISIKFRGTILPGFKIIIHLTGVNAIRYWEILHGK